MKAFVFVLLSLATALGHAHEQPLDEPPLRIAYGDTGPPWAWQEDNMHMGLLVDIANEALVNRMGLQISHHNFPWKRAQLNVEQGQMDALITNYTPKRQQYTLASDERVTNVRRSIFILADNPLIAQLTEVKYLHQLSPYSMGNYLGNGWAERQLKGMKVEWANDSRGVLKMLGKKRFDLYVANPISTRHKIREMELNNIIMLPNQLLDIKPSQFRLLIRRNSPYTKILPHFDKTLRSMKTDGTLKRIFAQYQ